MKQAVTAIEDKETGNYTAWFTQMPFLLAQVKEESEIAPRLCDLLKLFISHIKDIAPEDLVITIESK